MRCDLPYLAMRGLRLANVQVELDKLLAVRLRDAGDVRKLFDALKVGRRRRPWKKIVTVVAGCFNPLFSWALNQDLTSKNWIVHGDANCHQWGF